MAFPSLAVAKRAKPDLVIQKLTVHGLGTPLHAVIPASGIAPTFSIRVTTANKGKGKARASKTVVFIQHRVQVTVHVPSLKPGKSHTTSLSIANLKPRLGFAGLYAVADYPNRIKESNEGNNRLVGPPIAVLAQQWNVNSFLTNYQGLFAQDETDAEPGFYFRFSGYDNAVKQFAYQAIGPVKNAQQREGTCNYDASDTVGQNRWAASHLAIAVDLMHYNALVKSSATPSYQATEACLNPFGPETITDTVNLTFQDLTTSGTSPMAGQQMKPADTRLAASNTDGFETTWTWDFRADVP